MNPLWSQICQLFWCTMIQVSLDHWSWCRLPKETHPKNSKYKIQCTSTKENSTSNNLLTCEYSNTRLSGLLAGRLWMERDTWQLKFGDGSSRSVTAPLLSVTGFTLPCREKGVNSKYIHLIWWFNIQCIQIFCELPGIFPSAKVGK